jgi:hypothetical protein
MGLCECGAGAGGDHAANCPALRPRQPCVHELTSQPDAMGNVHCTDCGEQVPAPRNPPKPHRLQRVDRARVEEVIHVQLLRGLGKSEDDLVRVVHQYWSKEGRLLAEHDSTAPSEGVEGP